MDEFEQSAVAGEATGEADPFGGGDGGFGMAAAPLDGDDSSFAAAPLDGDESGFAAAPLEGGADAFGGDMGGDSMGGMGGMMGGGDMSAFGGADSGEAFGAAPDMGNAGGMGGMAMPVDTPAAPEPVPLGPRISEASLSAIAKWRMQHAEMVEGKKAREEAKQAEMRATAQADLEATKKAREEKKIKRMAVNREEQTQMQLQRNASTAEDGQAVWTQVGLICDLKDKANPTVDTSRMRSLLVQLKHA